MSRALIARLVLLGAVVLATHAGTLRNGFVWDDYPYMVENGALHDVRNIPLFFISGDAIGQVQKNPYYRPLTTTTFALAYAVFGNDPRGHHAMNILLHLITCVLVMFAVGRLTTPVGGLAGALMFAVHPAQAETVSYLSSRADILCALFMLGSFILYLRHLSRPSNVAYASSVGLTLLALFSKIVAVLMPAVVAVHLLLVARRRDRALLVTPYLAAAMAFLLLRGFVLQLESWGKHGTESRLATAGVILVSYFRNTFWPFDLRLIYDLPIRERLLDGTVIAAWTVVGLFVAGLALAARRRPVLAFGGAWFLGSLLPVSGLITLLRPSLMADRYLFIPLVGLAVAVGVGVQVLGRAGIAPWAKLAAAGAAGIAIAIGAATTVGREALWRDPLTLSETASREAPENFFVLNELGIAYGWQGRGEDAERTFLRMIALGAAGARIFNNLSWSASIRGDALTAERYLMRGLQCDPENPKLLTKLGELLIARQEYDHAADVLREAVGLNPYHPRASALLREVREKLLSSGSASSRPETNGTVSP